MICHGDIGKGRRYQEIQQNCIMDKGIRHILTGSIQQIRSTITQTTLGSKRNYLQECPMLPDEEGQLLLL